jgi:VanZ family protein
VRLIFTFLSIVYIAGIFLCADSPVVSVLAPFNPYSLLHIPLYGILTVLLIFSFFPFNLKTNVPKGLNDSNHPNITNDNNVLNVLRIYTLTHLRIDAYTRVRFLISGFIALIVAIADEIHQSFIPTRDASVIDVFLDAVGIVLILFLIVQLYKKKKILRTQLTQSAN